MLGEGRWHCGRSSAFADKRVGTVQLRLGTQNLIGAGA